MTSKRTIHARLHKAGLTPLKDTWLTPDQAAKVKAWDADNREAVLGKPATAQKEQDT